MTEAQHCPCHLELFTELLGAIRPCQELPWLGVPGYLTATASVQLCVSPLQVYEPGRNHHPPTTH